MSGEAAEAARLWDEGRRDEAVAIFAALRARRPEDVGVALRLGVALLQLGRGVEAVRALEAAAALAPGVAEVHAWLGRALALVHWEQRGPEAIGPLRAHLAAAPGDVRRHMALATTLLSCGQLAEAWPHYAWRWLAYGAAADRVPDRPLERPDPATWRGKRVLLFGEQGLGDSLQFLRYVPMVADRAGEVGLEVPGPLRLLAAGMDGRVRLADGAAEWDVALPLLHLPWAFGTDLDSIPAAVPYLHAAPDAVAAWRARLAGLPGLKVGLVWAGEPRPDMPDAHRIDRRRSLPLAALAPLGGVAGVSLVSLQKGAGAAQAPPAGMVLHDWTDELGDFADTAALMQALDLVISVDTSPLHLAGALGRKVWLLDRYDSCWRWMRERDDSPWYPTLRRFRQSAPGEWGGVVARVVRALREDSAFFL
jgi:hypothetical protein